MGDRERERANSKRKVICSILQGKNKKWEKFTRCCCQMKMDGGQTQYSLQLRKYETVNWKLKSKKGKRQNFPSQKKKLFAVGYKTFACRKCLYHRSVMTHKFVYHFISFFVCLTFQMLIIFWTYFEYFIKCHQGEKKLYLFL